MVQNLRAFIQAAGKSKSRNKIEVIWQYILFEWNDSDEEIDRAKSLSHELGVPIKWVITHTAGASKRFTPDSEETAYLLAGKNIYKFLTCDLQMSEIWKNQGIVSGKYSAKITASTLKISAPPGRRIIFPLFVKNLSRCSWEGFSHVDFRLGVLLRTETGKNILELQGVLLPQIVIAPEGGGIVFVDFQTPIESGIFQLLIDIIEEDVCWFHERSSQPLILTLVTSDIKSRELNWNRIVEKMCGLFIEPSPNKKLLQNWSKKLQQGLPFQNFLLDIYRENKMDPALWNSKCSLFWKRIQPLIQPYMPLLDF